MVNAPQMWRLSPDPESPSVAVSAMNQDPGAPDPGTELHRCVSATYDWRAKRLATGRVRA